MTKTTDEDIGPADKSMAGQNDQMYDLCRRSAMRARRLAEAGQVTTANKVLRQLAACQFSVNNNCPRQEDCRRRLTRQGAAPQDSSLTLFDWDRLQRLPNGYVDINGHLLRGGFQELFSAQDQWLNKIWHQKISTDVVPRYETKQMKTLLEMWQATQYPSLEKFDKGRLEEEGILPWLHVNQVASDGRSRAQHFAPKMIAITGKDYTGSCFEDHELGIFANLHRKLYDDLAVAGKPLYSVNARRRRLSYGQSHAMLRRLELPIYNDGKFSGSLVYLQSQ